MEIDLSIHFYHIDRIGNMFSEIPRKEKRVKNSKINRELLYMCVFLLIA